MGPIREPQKGRQPSGTQPVVTQRSARLAQPQGQHRRRRPASAAADSRQEGAGGCCTSGGSHLGGIGVQRVSDQQRSQRPATDKRSQRARGGCWPCCGGAEPIASWDSGMTCIRGLGLFVSSAHTAVHAGRQANSFRRQFSMLWGERVAGARRCKSHLGGGGARLQCWPGRGLGSASIGGGAQHQRVRRCWC